MTAYEEKIGSYQTCPKKGTGTDTTWEDLKYTPSGWLLGQRQLTSNQNKRQLKTNSNQTKTVNAGKGRGEGGGAVGEAGVSDF